MRQIIYTLLFLISTLNLFGQKSKETFKDKFVFIQKSTDTSRLVFKRTFRCVSKKGDDLPSLFYSIKKTSENIGANCFNFRSYAPDSSKAMTLTLDVYFGNDSILKANDDNSIKNTVFIFGSDKISKEIFSFKVGKKNIDMPSGKYFKSIINEGSEVKVNFGGFLGTTVFIKWYKNRHAQYLTSTGFGVAPALYPSANGLGVGFTINTGRVSYIDPDLGQLLIIVLKEHQEVAATNSVQPK